ncbi:MAG: hypothetical protein ACE5DM_02670 [Candidatus Nanoarchaeia archaeon]
MRSDEYTRNTLLGVFPPIHEFHSGPLSLHSFFYKQQQDGNELLQGIWFAEQILGHHSHQMEEAMDFMRVAAPPYLSFRR